MDLEKVREILRKQRPDLVPLESPAEPFLSDDQPLTPGDVDESDLSLSAWKSLAADSGSPMANKVDLKTGLNSDDLHQMFAPRDLKAGNRESGGKVEIFRSVKKSGESILADDAGISLQRKDLIIDEEEGLIGSQG